MKPSKNFPMSWFTVPMKRGMTFTEYDSSSGCTTATNYVVVSVDPLTRTVQCELATFSGSPLEAEDPNYPAYTHDGECAHGQKTETGFGTAYCKTCPAKFKFVNFNWVLT